VTTNVHKDELLTLLTAFTADRLALLVRLDAGARLVGHYDFNNTYQYVINRVETQVGWLEAALVELGAPLPAPSAPLPVPVSPRRGRKPADAGAYRAILSDDARQFGVFVERWRPRVEALTHARHRVMLNVILGESIEHRRLFEQAADGFEDLLGRRTGGVARVGDVLPVRWME
jgi:hypothetical protein